MGGGKLNVKIVNGRGLQNKDTFSKSDPYCMVELGMIYDMMNLSIWKYSIQRLADYFIG